jgi:hypothetical protein
MVQQTRLKHLLSLLLLALLSLGTLLTAQEGSKQVPPPKPEEIVVYVTKTGSKYHRANCRYVSKSKIPMTLKEAKKKYGPCSVCKPPQ